MLPIPSGLDVYEILKQEIVVHNDLLDVGCGRLQDLFRFDSSPFKRLIGFDKKLDVQPFPEYYQYKLALESEERQNDNYNEIWDEATETFFSRYSIDEKDVLEFEWQHDSYSLILCKFLLHFFCDEIKFYLIQRFYDSLEPTGLMYLRLNHSLHKDFADTEKSNQISEFIFQSNNEPTLIWYLVDEEDFVSKLKEKYAVLDQYRNHTSANFTVVIRK